MLSMSAQYVLLELKAMDFTYFHFLSHFYFLLFFFFYYSLFWNLGLGLCMMLWSCCHPSVTVTQSHVTIEECRRFWKDDVIQHV